MDELIETYNPGKSINFFLLGMLAAFMLVPGTILISNGHYFGFVLLAVWASLLTIRKGVQINYKRKELKFFTEYLWSRAYVPKSLRNYSGYRIKRTSSTYVFSSRIQSTQITQEFHVIEFLHKDKKKFELIAVGDLTTIREIAQKVEGYLTLNKVSKAQAR